MSILLDVPPVPDAVIEMSLSKCKIVPQDASVRRIPWFVHKCVYVTDVKTFLLTRIWSSQLHMMMIKLMEYKIK